MQPEDLAPALADVRRAYRLLQVYHRRVCDLLQTFDEAVTAQGLAFVDWGPLNVYRLPKRRKPFFRPEIWAWDLTPAYQVRCTWEQSTKGHARCVIVEVIADTGYTTVNDGEPDPATFQDESASATEIHVGLWSAHTKRVDWKAAQTLLKSVQGWEQGGPHLVSVGGIQHAYERLRLDMAALTTMDAVRQQMITPVTDWLRRP
ncbi:hypothetical protein [Chondromyces apiculatus]|nr:hypothetical protein [Chondromyces apiculatus]